MGSEELGANLFRITQTEAKMRREELQGLGEANTIHYAVGKEVRDTIEKLGVRPSRKNGQEMRRKSGMLQRHTDTRFRQHRRIV